MDVAGLGLGVASLLSLFQTCLDIHDTIESGREYGADYEVLATKLGIERMRLLLWGDMVGIPVLSGLGSQEGGGLSPQVEENGTALAVDPRLCDARIVKAVVEILQCMRQLFDDTGALTRRYGLAPASSVGIAAIAQAGSQLATVAGGRNALVTTFKKTYTRLRTSAAQRQRAASLATTARWVIKDKKRFQRFVDELREFNDSLFALFPDVGPQALKAMAAEIEMSTDADDLQIVELAVAEIENGGEQLAQAASLRITDLSQHTTSLATNNHDDDEDQNDDSAEADSLGIQDMGNVNMRSLTRQLKKLELALRAELRGSLQVSIRYFWGGDYYGVVTWEGYQNEEYRAQVEHVRESEYVKNPYLAWSLMYASEQEACQHGPGDFIHHDTEASRTFAGRFPGTGTVEGYGASLQAWAREHKPAFDPQPVFVSTGDPPARLQVPELVALLRDLQLRRALPWGESDEGARKYLEGLLGSDSMTKSAPYEYSAQVIDLVQFVNRSDIFDDVRVGASLGQLALPTSGRGKGLANFLYQMIVAYELKLRLARTRGHAFGNVTGRVVAAMQAAERWVDGVWVQLVKVHVPGAEHQEAVSMHSLVHERQVEGLVHFAELLAWPALREMREFVEDAYADMQAGMRINIHMWDWLYGAMLPGNAFIFTIMSALVAATPSLKHLGVSKYYESGLVLDDRSYWRAKWVLGSVLGGIRDIRAANGWVGPCPVPVGADGEKMARGWWRVRARQTSFALPDRITPHADTDETGQFSGLRRVEGSSSRAEWVRTIGDPAKWVVPVGPSNAPDTVELRAVRLKSLAREHGLAEAGSQKEGAALMAAAGNKAATDVQAQNNSTPAEDEREPAQRAILELTINGQQTSFTLYNNIVFIAAPRCIDGPHAVHERDLPKLQHILRVGQLPGHIHNDHRVLVIDATGEGECELAARAWCAEQGQHAIVRRGTAPCFACAVRAASEEGLGIGCLIWT